MNVTAERVPRRVWIGLVAFAFYVVIAVAGGLVFDAALGPDPDPVLELALTHLVPLPLAIAAGVAFARWSGWWDDIWTDRRVSLDRPRRWWMLAIPAAIAIQIISLFAQAPWASITVPYLLVGLLCYLLVGLGEELFTRGILLESVQAHHGETVTVLVTALAFGVAHSLGSALNGVPASSIAFQVAVTAMDGVLFYAALRATGTLWVPILLHGLGDYGRWLAAEDGEDHTSAADPIVQWVLIVLSIAVLVSVIREDHRTKRANASATPPVTRDR